MRIISGVHKGRQLTAPKNLPVRPTTDRAKEALFNWLMHRYHLPDLRFLELFAGTGNISYEMASRGCQQVLAVDQHPGCCRFIRQTAAALNLPIEVQQADVFHFLAHAEPADFIFADPPYDLPRLKDLPDLVFAQQLVAAEGILVLEHDQRVRFEAHPHLLEVRVYGQSQFSIFTPTQQLP